MPEDRYALRTRGLKRILVARFVQATPMSDVEELSLYLLWLPNFCDVLVTFSRLSSDRLLSASKKSRQKCRADRHQMSLIPHSTR